MNLVGVWSGHVKSLLRSGTRLLAAEVIATATVLLAGHWWPAAPWLLIPAAVVLYAAVILFESPRPARVRLILACLAAVALCALVAAANGLRDPEHYALSLDDATYHRQAKAIAEAWRSGLFPQLSLKGSAPYYIGSLHTGYQRLLAGVYYVAGSDFRLGILANFFAVMLVPLFVFRAISTTVGAPEQTATQTPAAERDALAGAWLAALYPGLGYWSAWLLKDVVLAMLFIAGVAAALDLLVHKRADVGLCLGALLYGLGICRAYAALSLVGGMVVYILARLPRRLSSWGLVGLLLGAVLFGYTETGGAYVRQLVYSLAELIPGEVRTPAQAFFLIVRGFPRLFLAPYAWVKAYGPNPTYGLYPGMWWLYLIVYPLAAAGLFRLGRQNVLPATVPLVAWALSAYLLLISYVGDAPRQRLYLDMVMCVFAGCGRTEPRRRLFFAAWYGCLGAYIAVHLATLKWRY
jgi:hypothetical protein